ncbi:glycosyltransferase family 4 protein [Lactiplantibacillus pingfangensis]|uniref:glycosyltransferase family 4 protein n=1 Tax=Lactiplantibacillus pingfangensis TaxID=2559915 RepID=UPI00148533E6|nr:glycosyltransferase family 4 protein [Lactiplantibacillus pingfangensis]
MKILYVISTLKNSGPVNVLYSLCKRLSKVNDIRILTLSPETNGSEWKKFSSLPVTVESLSLSRLEFIYKGRDAFQKYIDSNSFDVLHSHGIRADKLVAECKSSCLKMSTAHNSPEVDYVSTYGYIIGKSMARKQFSYWRRMSKIACCSSYIQAQISLKVSKKCLLTVHNGTDKIKSSKGVPTKDQKIKLLCLGTLSTRKNTEYVVRNFSKVESRLNQLELIVVGGGPLYEKLSDKFQSSKIHFTGQVANPQTYIENAHWMISASLSEGLPMAIIEGLSSDCNLILSDIGPHREIVDLLDSKLYRLFEIGNEVELQKILLAVDAGRIEWCSGSEKYWNMYFSDLVMAEKYQKIYQKWVNDYNFING